MNEPRVIVVTGAAGFLGRALCGAFAHAGWSVRAGVRNPRAFVAPCEGVAPFRCDLPDKLDRRAFAGASVCVHAAYTMRFRTLGEARRTNWFGTRAVLRAARRAGARFVFVSSCSAHEGAQSYYGRSKFAIEQRLDPVRDLVVRPGLILGPGSLFARMEETLRHAAVVPLFDGGRQRVQAIALDELCQGILRAVERGLAGRLVLAEPDGIEMRELMRLLARRASAAPRFVPVPSLPVLWGLKVAEAIGLGLPITSENLLGLRGMVHQPSARDLALLDLRVRGARQWLWSAKK